MYLGIRIEQPVRDIPQDTLESMLSNKKGANQNKDDMVKKAMEIIIKSFLSKPEKIRIRRQGKNIVALCGGEAAIIPKSEESIYEDVVDVVRCEEIQLEKYIWNAGVFFGYGIDPESADDSYEHNLDIGTVFVSGSED